MATRELPTRAEHFRQDVIALALDIRSLMVEQEYAQDADDMVRVAYIRKQVYGKAQRLRELAKELRKS